VKSRGQESGLSSSLGDKGHQFTKLLVDTRRRGVEGNEKKKKNFKGLGNDDNYSREERSVPSCEGTETEKKLDLSSFSWKRIEIKKRGESWVMASFTYREILLGGGNEYDKRKRSFSFRGRGRI